jgi:hypothetical protein
MCVSGSRNIPKIHKGDLRFKGFGYNLQRKEREEFVVSNEVKGGKKNNMHIRICTVIFE